MTPKMQLFVDGKLAGLDNRAAGLAAGYSRSTVDQAVSRLAKRADVKKAIAAGKRKQTKSSSPAGNEDNGADDAPLLHTNYTDPLQFFMESMNNARLPLGMRFEAAKQAMPYMHGRIGEKGKKEKNTDAAHAVTGRGKFAPKAPPHLHAVK